MNVIIRYRIRPDALQEHLRLLQAAFDEMAIQRPDLTYQVHQLDDDGTFIEIVHGDQLPAPLAILPAFQRYRRGLEDRCAEPLQMIEPARSFAYPQAPPR